MLGQLFWAMRLRQVPKQPKQLRDNRNWLAFVGRFALAGRDAGAMATSQHYSLDHDGLTFGTLYEAKKNISVGSAFGPLQERQRYYFMGFEASPPDDIRTYHFETGTGAPVRLSFEMRRGSDVKAAHSKLLNDRLLVAVPGERKRSRELAQVRGLLRTLRRRNGVH